MATPARSTNPKASEAQAILFLTVLALFMAIGGLASLAALNATARAVLDFPTMPLLQMWAERSPDMDAFLRRSPPFIWFLIQAAMIVVPCLVALGLYLMFTHDTRRLRRMALRRLILKREGTRLDEMTEDMEAKDQARRGQSKAGKSPRPGEAATDAERLKDVFRKRPPE